MLQPTSVRHRYDATNRAGKKDMPVRLCHIHACLEHQHTERNTRYPAHEAYYTEDREENKDDGGRVELFDEVEDGGADAERNVQDACDPYELRCKSAGHCKVKP